MSKRVVTDERKGSRDHHQEKRFQRLAWAPVPLFILAIALLKEYGPRTSYESPFLIMVLNLFFSMIASYLVAVISGRSFLANGRPWLLTMGSGMVIWGTSSLIAAVGAGHEVNFLITSHNLGVLLSAVFHFAGALMLLRPEWQLRATGIWLPASFAAALGCTSLIAVFTHEEWIPVFFIPGQGGTPLRQAVLVVAIVLLGLTAVLVRQTAQRPTSSFRFWYSWGLVLLAVGLAGVMVQTTVGSAVGWAGRTAQYLGGLYMMIAAVSAMRESGSWNIPMDEILSASREQMRLFIEHAPAALAMFDRDMRYLVVSRRWMSDYGLGDRNLIGLSHYDVFRDIPERWKEVHRRGLAGDVVRKESDRYDRADGTTQWLSWEVRPWYTTSGHIGGIVIFTEDITARMAAEERLAYLASFPQLNPNPVLEVDFAGTVTFVNPAVDRMLTMLGRGRENANEFVPNDLNAIISAWDKASPMITEREVRIADRVFTVNVYLAPELDAIRLYVYDVTERKRAEEALRESEERLRFALETSHTGAWDLDLVDHTAFRSLEHDRIFGYAALLPRWTYELFLEHVLPEDREAVDAKFRQALLAQSDWGFECRIRRADGEIRWIWASGRLRRGADGARRRMAGIVQDITERKQVEEALRQSEARLASFAEATFEGIVESEAGMILDCNEQFARMLGSTVAELKGAAVADLIPPEDRGRVLANIRDNRDSVIEHAVIRRDGTRIIIEAHGRPASPGSIRRLTALRDITERKRTDEALRELTEDLEKKVVERTRFYSLLARTSEAIIRNRDRQALFDEICRIIVETGGLKLAWIGFVDPETRAVRPAASCGATAYLAGIRIIAADVPEGRGPTGLAIREGHHVVNLDFEENEEMAPWRERARKHGIRSSSAFPLRKDGVVTGALTIYSDLPRFFTGDEVSLLRSLADNLEFSIETMAMEQKQRESEEGLRRSAAEIAGLYEELKGTNEELRNLQAHIEAVREGERAHIAREVHDQLGQVMTALKMDISWLIRNHLSTSAEVRERSAEMLELIDGAIHSVKRITSELRPSVLDDFGLQAAVEWAAQEFGKRSGVTCRVRSHPASITMDRTRSTVIYRVLQESLTNIARHSGAKNVTVSLDLEGERFRMTIEDDGKGIPQEKIDDPASYGLIGMRERLLHLGGTVVISGESGKGTTITASIPLSGLNVPAGEAPSSTLGKDPFVGINRPEEGERR